MRIPGAAQRAFRRLQDNRTPLYDYIMKTLGGHTLPPLGAGVGALTSHVARAIQKPGFRGFLDLFVFEKPHRSERHNKFTKLGSMNFQGIYPRELCTKKGLEVFYGDQASK